MKKRNKNYRMVKLSYITYIACFYFKQLFLN